MKKLPPIFLEFVFFPAGDFFLSSKFLTEKIFKIHLTSQANMIYQVNSI